MKKRIIIYIKAVLYSAIVISGIISCTNTKKPPETKTIEKAKTTIPDSTHLIGMWLDEGIKTDNGNQVAYQIVTKGPKTYIQVITFKDKKLSVNDNPEISPSASEIRKEKNKYISVENAKDVYLIENSGDLLIYDATGFIVKCKKML